MPVHKVTLTKPYYIGETEVTQAVWQAVMGSNPSGYKGSNRPVENVTWNDCQTFISKLNAHTGMTFRLPTEAEWEFAARGGNISKGYIYSGSNKIEEVAWYETNADDKNLQHQTVKKKKPNELGLYDMSGNVREWCQDWYGRYTAADATDPKGPSTGSWRVSRGGCWNYSALNCHCAHRYVFTPTISSYDLGLRLVSQ